MAYCTNCGQPLADGQNFCANCGAPQAAQTKYAEPPAYQGAPDYQNGQYPVPAPYYQANPGSGLFTAAFVFIVISGALFIIFGVIALLGLTAAIMHVSGEARMWLTILPVFYLIPLAWIIPMAVRTYKIKMGQKPNTIGFGVCVLLFASVIGGILLLCAPKNQ